MTTPNPQPSSQPAAAPMVSVRPSNRPQPAQPAAQPEPAAQVALRVSAFLEKVEAAGMDKDRGQMRYDATFKVPVMAGDLPRLMALLSREGLATFSATPATPEGLKA